MSAFVLRDNLKMAWASLRSARWRSLLTMLGVIIGVVSVVTTVSLGEGVKQQVLGQVHQLGGNLLTVRPGKIVARNNQGAIKSINLFSSVGVNTLTEQDIEAARKVQNVTLVTPFSFIAGVAQTEGREFNNGVIVATSSDMPEILNQKILYGGFFTDKEDGQNVAVIGKQVAEQLFQENVPIGRSMKIRGQDFIVRGVFDDFNTNPLTPGVDFNAAIVIPYGTGKQISNGMSSIFQLLIKSDKPNQTRTTMQAVRSALLQTHGGQEDFTILTQQESLAVTNNVVNLITSLIAGVAAISLVVGGIGIMNIMLVSVSERMQEIGVRKAIGATNQQILGQFLLEATLLSFVGGIIGVFVSILVNFGLRIFTDLQPVITLPVVGLALIVSVLVGVIFGAMPALRAARRDPIEAIRHL